MPRRIFNIPWLSNETLSKPLSAFGFACLTLAVCGQAALVIFTQHLRFIPSMHDL